MLQAAAICLSNKKIKDQKKPPFRAASDLAR
jgi:hypothetical protein